MSPSHIARRSTISVAALIGAFALLFSGVAPVQAAPGPANIDQTRTGSITIHKFAETETDGAEHQGQELAPSMTAGLSPLEGVQFTISRFDGIDLRTAEGWAAMEGITVDSDRAKTVVDTVKTDASGIGSKSGLPLGLYLVEETGFGDNDVVHPTAPFLVSVPTAGVSGDWLYDVHAYPKNSVVSLDMVADDSRAFGMNGTGTIDWKVTTSIPYLPANQSLNTYSITLNLTDHLTTPTPNDVTLRVGGMEIPRGQYSVNASNGMLTVAPPEGATGLDAYQGQPVELTVATKMTANEDQKGIVGAQATVQVNDAETRPAAAESDWGAVRVIMNDAEDAPLSGATFELRRTQDGDPIEVDGRTSFTTQDNGELMIPGIRVGERYYLVQTGAPAGYTPAQARNFEVVAADTNTVGGDSTHPNVVTFNNEQVSGFALPITGSFGSLPFLLAGLLLVATALLVNRSRRRRLARAV
ncbi:SpaH/EbpB family LPXTG-anchored major pilin [Nesterenkonia sp. Act20]|uniref:SpaH/EbpB family LPXTG-anchored major pilin n=1 Tax=Nesterenkonia sp. Act20 TaxID=1483432 RepID=UPI001C43E476|nr:SpaH/EbpB family LPXTG-anchored major pilin [Nesterenkonia sp. Act20]